MNFTYHINSNSKEYEQICAKLLTLCKQQAVKTIMFTACSEGDGVSTTALNVANVLARVSPMKVLLLEIRPNEVPANNSLFDKQANDLPTLLNDYQKGLLNVNDPSLNLQEYGHNNLVRVSAKTETFPASILASELFKGLLSLFKEHFDYVILDTPPVIESLEYLALAAQTDGVVIVFRAEHTRQEVAKNVRLQLEGVGAKLLGSIVNMEKHYIPDFIYRRL